MSITTVLHCKPLSVLLTQRVLYLLQAHHCEAIAAGQQNKLNLIGPINNICIVCIREYLQQHEEKHFYLHGVIVLLLSPDCLSG